MKKSLLLVLFWVLLAVGVCYATAVIEIRGWPITHEDLNCQLNTVTRITSTTYQPGGAGTTLYPCWIQLHGISNFRLDPFTAVSSTNFTPGVNDFSGTIGDWIYIEHPQYFRITPVAAAFSATVEAIEQ